MVEKVLNNTHGLSPLLWKVTRGKNYGEKGI